MVQRGQRNLITSCSTWRVNPSGAETRIFLKNKINTMAADALAMQVARASAAMVLTMSYKQTLVFHEENFQICGLS